MTEIIGQILSEDELAQRELIRKDRAKRTVLNNFDGDRSEIMSCHKEPLAFGHDARMVLGYDALVNEAGDFIVPALDQYHIIDHKAFIGDFEALLAKGGLTISEQETKLSENHSRLWSRYWLDGHNVDVQPGDTIRLGFQIRNSYDGSSGVQIGLVAQRLVCSNGMTRTGVTGERFYRKHTGELDPDLMSNWMATASETFADWMNGLKTLGEVQVTPDYFKSIFTVPEKLDSEDLALSLGANPEILKRLRAIPERSRKAIIQEWSVNGGESAWDGYNAITAIATHNTKNVNVGERLEKAAESFAQLVQVAH